MNQKLKVATILGTRPEIIKLSATIRAFDKYFEHLLIHTGQNWDYNLSEVFFQELRVRKPDYFLACVGSNLGETIGNIISRSYTLFENERPEALLILGDTNSALSAISAKRLKIPIFHMEAGNRCFDENLPEEINRRIVDHLADVNLPYTEHARRYLLAEGVHKEYIFVTGSPMAEIFREHRVKIRSSTILDQLGLKPQSYIVVSSHREENIDHEDNFRSLMTAIDNIADHFRMPIIFSTHPRTRDRMKKRGYSPHILVRNIEPLGFFDYNRLQSDSFCVLSDSGTLAEESSILGFCAISLRTSTERPEVLDKGSFVVGGITTSEIMQSIDLSRTILETAEVAPLPPDYQDKNVSLKVVKLIQSYTKIINSRVWGK
jgi:UDP-N-acetylglucosamine 2-epimerase